MKLLDWKFKITFKVWILNYYYNYTRFRLGSQARCWGWYYVHASCLIYSTSTCLRRLHWSWKVGCLVLVKKGKGDPKSLIILLSPVSIEHMDKIFERFIQKRLTFWLMLSVTCHWQYAVIASMTSYWKYNFKVGHSTNVNKILFKTILYKNQ